MIRDVSEPTVVNRTETGSIVAKSGVVPIVLKCLKHSGRQIKKRSRIVLNRSKNAVDRSRNVMVLICRIVHERNKSWQNVIKRRRKRDDFI